MTITPPAATLAATVSDQKPGMKCAVRVADIAALRSDRSTVIGQRRIPARPVFEEAFSAFARGTLVQTETGPVAVEDLYPGDKVITHDGTGEIVWIGSASFSPSDDAVRRPLTRIMADSFGVSRPENFITLGPSARLLQTLPGHRAETEDRPVMTPARTFADGVNVIEVTPPTPVRLFHIALRRHAAIMTAGLAVESFHPGNVSLREMSEPLRTAYLGLFPHIGSLSEFGPVMFERLPTDGQDQTAA